jgi:glycerol-3-phosphate acyltransferase PlsX
MHTIRLAVDVKSGDLGSQVLLEGVLEAKRRCGIDFIACLCGDGNSIENGLKQLKHGGVHSDSFIIEDSPENVEPGEAPSRVWKTKKRSSVIRSIALQKEGVVEATLSAGDTGILMGAAIFMLGRAGKASRPALAAFLPTVADRPSLVLDVGANLDCRTEHLATFGLMGHDYYRHYFNVDNPRVALLNIGHEPSKGSRTLADAGQRLAGECRGYCGFIEGSDVLSGKADVIVCDGFVGNVLLKACESFHTLTDSVLAGSRRLAKAVRKKMTILNPENYGAVPLLGIHGVVFKAHGSSSAEAFANALIAAVTAVHREIPQTRQDVDRKGWL